MFGPFGTGCAGGQSTGWCAMTLSFSWTTKIRWPLFLALRSLRSVSNPVAVLQRDLTVHVLFPSCLTYKKHAFKPLIIFNTDCPFESIWNICETYVKFVKAVWSRHVTCPFSDSHNPWMELLAAKYGTEPYPGITWHHLASVSPAISWTLDITWSHDTGSLWYLEVSWSILKHIQNSQSLQMSPGPLGFVTHLELLVNYSLQISATASPRMSRPAAQVTFGTNQSVER